jgi:hypothetical protein
MVSTVKKKKLTLMAMNKMVEEYAAELETLDQRARAFWAADCAERVLHYFEHEHPRDDRPRRAIEGARSWAHGEISMMDGRRLAVAAHAAARTCTQPTATAAARATGHAVATAHSRRHARGGAIYALFAIALELPDQAGKRIARELKWQRTRLAKYKCRLPRRKPVNPCPR